MAKKTFSAQVKDFGLKSEDLMVKVFRMVSLECFNRVITRTPVDTGRARANWQPSLDNEPAGASLVTGLVEKSQDEADRERHAQQANAIALGAVEKLDGQITAKTRKAMLTNNLVYIEALENGHSQKQAPNGMVGITVAEFPAIVEQIARKIRQ